MVNNTNIHTADHTEDIAKESAQEKKSGNTKRLLFQNLPIIKQIGGLLTGAFGIVETTGDALYRTLSLVARPQDIKNTDKIIKNGIKTIIGEKKIEEGKKKYIKPKLAKDFMQYSNPDLEETKYFDTQGTDLSLAPKKSDNRFKKIIKGIPFISGKIIKAPVRAANTIIGGITDIFRFMKKNMNPEIKEDSKGHYFKHYYPRYYKAKHAWKNLTSRAYKGNTSGQNTIQETKKEESDTNQKKSRRSRLRPFGKKKSKQETKESETTENKKEVTLPSTPPKESKPDIKKETIQEKDIIKEEKSTDKEEKSTDKEEKSTDKKEKSTESKDEVDIMKDYTTSFKSIKPLKTAFQQKNKEELEKHKNIILETNTEIIEEDYENLNPTQQKIIDDIKAVQKRIKNGEYEISEGEVETITNDQRELLKNGHNNIKEYKEAVEEKNKNNFNNAIDKIGKAEEAFRITDSSKLSEEEQSMLQDIKETIKEIRETKFDDTRT